MNRSIVGVGSALMILVFTVLCLTVFTLISLAAANADAVMATAAADAAKDYYQADTFAEIILAEILDADDVPDVVRGVEITSFQDGGGKYVTYSCSVSENKELFVEAVIFMDSYDILKWKMQDVGLWEIEDGPSLWNGE